LSFTSDGRQNSHIARQQQLTYSTAATQLDKMRSNQAGRESEAELGVLFHREVQERHDYALEEALLPGSESLEELPW
tara:strand:+ start:6396 stop:6626 length:231 start_codon:yes stop_codon:yes gene_type:complete